MSLNFFVKILLKFLMIEMIIIELENIQPNENNIKIIIKPSISVQIFNIILQYIYGGIVDLENCETRFIYDLMLASDEFELEELTNKLKNLLIETKASWLRTHFSFIYHSIFSRANFKKLENFCNDIVVKYPNLIFDTDDFTSLEESALVSLLKQNDLQMKEAILQKSLPNIRYFHLSSIEVVDKIEPFKKILDKQLWEDINQSVLVIELSPQNFCNDIVVKYPNLIFDTDDFTSLEESALVSLLKQNDLQMKEAILQKSLPNIRYFHLSSIEVVDKIEPFKKILDKQLWEDINQSVLVIELSPHGFVPQTFWNMCHGHVCTVVLVKVKGTDEIIGGYNPLTWDKNAYGRWIETKDSFIFSLKIGNIQNSILSRVKNPKCAIYNRPNLVK
ncbi:hypothetical protein Glove_301g65 [Diversispora epigaea]|uniref:TLDc domain-containing protein n=1 Tax=Diversispora epigaea TaxID=1348612 RepID=A0A397HX70_9GLOM|nr:hypothetical protein Glove_301g65 [Diversispora epigaea]